MRNLKRILSLAMASIMLVGMMAISASAADFPDSDKIENTDAVNTLVSLGIIKGKDDGNFDPEGIVTRAEMAKMICVALNKGKDPNLSGGGMYPDTVGHWASGYIDYCANLKIVAGDNNGKFNPNNTVTGVEAAKMILIAIGYDAESEGFVNNAKWDLNISARASERGLMEDMSINIKDGLTRDNAAQMIWNGLQATMIEYDYKLNTENGDLVTKAIAQDKVDKAGNDVTLLNSKFNLLDDTGILSVVSYNEDTKEYTYTVSLSAINTADLDAASDGKAIADLTTTADYSAMYGQKVKVLYTAKSNGDTDKVYGIYGVSKNVLTTTVADLTAPSTLTDKNFKVDGTKYDLDAAFNATPAYEVKYGAAADDTNSYKLDDLAAYDPSSTVVLVSNDSNKAFNFAVVIPVDVKKVTFVGKDSITAGTTYKFEDDIIADGIKKNDFVKIVKAANSFTNQNTVSKLDMISGTVGATRTGEAKVDGTWYKYASGVSALEIGADYDLYVIGGYIYNADKTSESATMSDVILITDPQPAKFGVSEAKAYFTDGTNAIIKVSKVDSTEGAVPTDQALYTYKLKSGNYELTKVDAKNTAGADGYASAGTSFANKKIGAYYIADDAAIFVAKDSKAGYKYYTGVQAKKWADFTVASSVVLYSTVNGLKTAQAAFITLTDGNLPSTSGDTAYGYITTKPETVKVGDDTFTSYTVWTKNGAKDVLDKDQNSANAAKGDVVSFKELGDDQIDTVTVLTSAKKVAITGISGNDLAIHNPDGSLSEIIKSDNDTVILYVNSEAVEGVNGGEIEPATMQADGSYILNAWVVARGTGATDKTIADLIVYDVNNDIDNFANDVAAGRAGYTITEGSTGTGFTFELDKDYACEGDVVKITVTTTTAAGGSDCAITVTPSGTNVDTAAVTITVPKDSASGTVVTGEYVVKDDGTNISGTVTLTASGTVS